MTTRNCKYCGEDIHPMRLEIIPNTETCVKCSKEKPKAGRIITHGTGEEIYTELEVVTREQAEKLARYSYGYSNTDIIDPDDNDQEGLIEKESESVDE